MLTSLAHPHKCANFTHPHTHVRSLRSHTHTMTITIGQAIWASVKPIIKIYLIIGTGALLARLALLSVETTRAISDLVLAVLLPCLAFNKIVGELEARDAKTVGIVAISAVLLYATGLGAAFVARSVLPCPRGWRGGILAGGMFPNISDLPIAYLQTMDTFVFTQEEGARGIACAIIFLATFLLCVFNFGGFRLIEMDFEYADEESMVPGAEELAPEQKSELHSIPEQGEDTEPALSPSASSTSSGDSITSGESLYTLDSNIASLAPTHTRSTAVSSLASMSTYAGSLAPVQAYGAENASQCSSCALHSAVSASSENSQASGTSRISRGSVASYSSYASGLERRRADSMNTLHSVRSIERRTEMPLQGLPDLVNEYSNVDQFGRERHVSSASRFSTPHTLYSTNSSESTIAASIYSGYYSDAGDGADEKMPFMDRIRSAKLTRLITSDATVSKHDIEHSGEDTLPEWIRRVPGANLITFFLTNCLRPCSVAVFAGLFIAFMPWLKALFVTSKHTPYVGLAPDNEPVLSFVMDFTGYLGAASVPFGLLLLGATLGRLKFDSLYPGFWKTAAALVIMKLCVMPIFGVLWCDRLVKAGWCTWEEDKMLLFVIAMTWGLPTMTTLIYFTASYTPPDTPEHVQMDCTSFFIVLQYPLLIISLPFLVTYMLMVQLKV